MTTHPRSLLVLAAALAAASVQAAPQGAPAAAPPALYKRVASVHWVVKDIGKTMEAWSRLGVTARDLGELRVSGSLRGESGSARVRLALARLDAVEIVWVQPVDAPNAFTEYLQRHGEGVFSVNYDAGSPQALEAEVARLAGLGVEVLQRGELASAGAPLSIVHMDTEAEGKYVLGIVARGGGPATAPALEAPASALPFPAKLSQYALVVMDLQPVSAYWEKLGLPKMDVTHGPLTDLRYRGEPGRFDQKLGWHRHGTVTWEWIEPVQGPTVYVDFLKSHGEGFHHFALDVQDMDAAIAALEKLGAPIVQSGGWGEKGKPGSGRFAYADTSAHGGVTIELLWNKR